MNDITKKPSAAGSSTEADDSPSPAPAETAEEETNSAAEAREFKDRWLRAVADLDNYRKRAARERQETTQFANQALIEKLVPVLDNLDMALAATATASAARGAAADWLRGGVEMIHSQLKKVLRDAGLEEIESLGQPFNPAWAEAVSQQESATVPEGTVVQQLRPGYKLRERLLRPATVVVARRPQT